MSGVLERLFGAGRKRGNSSRPPHMDRENGEPFSCQGPIPVHGEFTQGRTALAEMVGTFILVFSACGVVSCSYISKGELGLTEYALTGGASLVVLSIVVGPISGAHVNPAITFAFASIGRFPWSRVPFYVVAQIAGATSAAYLGRLVYKTPPELAATRPTASSMAAFWAELFATMFIMLTSSALSFHVEAIGQATSFAIGAVIALAVLITGPVSGGSMNPARSLGPAVAAWKFDHLWLYFVAPTLGALAGAFLYKFMQLPLTSSPRGRCNSSLSSSSSPSSLPAPAPVNVPPAS